MEAFKKFIIIFKNTYQFYMCSMLFAELVSTLDKEFKRDLGRDASETKVFGGVLSYL